jgi:hypothetical protein
MSVGVSPRGRPAFSAVELQRAVRLLGWPIKVDGVLGARTTAAVRDFQRGWAYSSLVATGKAGPRTHAALRASIRRGGRCSQHFNFRTFRCPDCGWIKLDRALVRGLERYQEELGEAVAVRSGHRNPAANAALGGLPGSQHLDGLAADVDPALTVDRVVALRGFSGIGYDPGSGLVRHLDVRHCGSARDGATTARPAIWAIA